MAPFSTHFSRCSLVATRTATIASPCVLLQLELEESREVEVPRQQATSSLPSQAPPKSSLTQETICHPMCHGHVLGDTTIHQIILCFHRSSKKRVDARTLPSQKNINCLSTTQHQRNKSPPFGVSRSSVTPSDKARRTTPGNLSILEVLAEEEASTLA